MLAFSCCCSCIESSQSTNHAAKGKLSYDVQRLFGRRVRLSRRVGWMGGHIKRRNSRGRLRMFRVNRLGPSRFAIRGRDFRWLDNDIERGIVIGGYWFRGTSALGLLDVRLLIICRYRNGGLCCLVNWRFQKRLKGDV